MNEGAVIVGICIVCVAAVFFSGCIGPTAEKPVNPALDSDTNQTPGEISTTTSAEKAVVDANNKFALKLYLTLCNDPRYLNATVFFSPFSISSALAITYEGARGSTADEIQSVLFFPNDSTEQRRGFGQLFTNINQGNSRYALKTANALWAENTYPFLPDYVHTAQTYYGANTTNLDFKNQPENSRVAINTWVEDQTNNKIRDLIPSGGINSLTRLVITNAVYFKGAWVEPFEKNETKDDIFTIEPGKTVPVRMMHMTDSHAVFRYLETDNIQVLEMPYATDSKKQLSMLVLLPKGKALTTFERSLNVQNLSELRNGLIRQRVNVEFPVFKIETKYDLPPTLISMGMTTAFTEKADFSGMDGTKNLFIGDVIHQAFIEVNEEGTEAAAATAVVMKATAIQNKTPIPVFRADHPFIFLIQDNDTENILFLGRVNNPNS